MRLILSCLLLLSPALALSGCSAFKGNKDASPAAPDPKSGPARFPTSTDPIVGGPTTPGTTTTVGSSQAVIAGRVLDEFGRPAGNTFVRLVAVSEKEASEPVEVAATAEGYFTIQGLKPGVDYKLIARTKTGDTLIAGQTQTAAPNIRVVIKISRDLAGKSTPDTPGHVGDSLKGPKTSLGTPEPLPPAWKTGPADATKTGDTPRAFEPDVPAVRVPTPPAPLPTPKTPGGGIVDRGMTWPPVLDVTPKDTRPLTPIKPEEPRPAISSTLGPARIPSCVLVGKQLINFALNDINGEAWEFKSHHKGKLVLVDFWGTGCIPCRQTLPELKDLDLKYRSQGLEIVGIAYEGPGTPQEQAYRVNEVMKRNHITYRQLLGAGGACPVRTQFGVRFIPTLVLVDDNGWILWRHEGRPDRLALDELERWIQRRLPKS